MKIVFLDAETYKDALDISSFEELGKVTSYPFTDAVDTLARIQDADVIVTNKVRINAEHMQSCPQLKLICIAATGMDNVDVAYAEANGIAVKNAVNYSSESVAEITLSLILALKNQIRYYHEYVQNGNYAHNKTFTHIGKGFSLLENQHIGIIGLGNIGRKAAKTLSVLGAKVSYYSPSGNKQDEPYEFYSDLKTFLSEIDILSLHCPLTDRTRDIISAQELKQMKSTALLVNVSRGAVVNEKALADAIQNEEIAGAAIDVYEQEPMCADSPYMAIANQPNVLLTPHIAWSSKEARVKLLEIVKGHIEAVMELSSSEFTQ